MPLTLRVSSVRGELSVEQCESPCQSPLAFSSVNNGNRVELPGGNY